MKNSEFYMFALTGFALGGIGYWTQNWHFVAIAPVCILLIVLKYFGVSRKACDLTTVAWIVLIGGPVIALTKGWVAGLTITGAVAVCIILFSKKHWREAESETPPK